MSDGERMEHWNGTLGDLTRVDVCCRTGREDQALDLLDRMLGLSDDRDLAAEIARLRQLGERPDPAAEDEETDLDGLELDEQAQGDGMVALSMDFSGLRLPHASLRSLILRRSLCFAALAEARQSDPAFRIRAGRHCDLVLGLFPQDAELLVLVGQIGGVLVGTALEVRCLEDAARLAPDCVMLRANVERLLSGVRAFLEQEPDSSAGRTLEQRLVALEARLVEPAERD